MRKVALARAVGAVLVGLTLTIPAPAPALEYGKKTHALALYGKVRYSPAEFRHFPYVNPDAPKGGEIVLGSQGGYDSFNPYSLKGRKPSGLGLIFDTLTVASGDESFSRYGHLAQAMRVRKDGSAITFFLHPKARWHDGKPVTPEDVVFSFNSALAESSSPFYRQYYAGIEKIEKSGKHAVTFTFRDKESRELSLILGDLPILAKHDWQQRSIAETTLEPPLGSGPYRIAKFDPGRNILYRRVPDYWGKDLPTARGAYNFDRIRYDVYRDVNVLVEAVKSGKIDFRAENSSKNWAVSYQGKALQEGRLIKRLVPLDVPQGMQGYVFNLRRPIFQDAVLREAIAYAFDFEWSNRTLFYGQYERTRSYFDNSELAARDLPSAAELELLSPYRGQLDDRVFTESYAPPDSRGTARGLRANLESADRLLNAGGYRVEQGKRISPHSGEPIAFEMLLFDSLQERIALPFAQNLKRLGIAMRVRTVDAAQYVSRLEKFDYDMVVAQWGQSESPGNEQREFWTSRAAQAFGSRNLSGLANPAVDSLVDRLIRASSREVLVTSVRALDRVLQWQFLVVPHFHISSERIVYWDRFGIPSRFPRKAGPNILYWWTVLPRESGSGQ